MADNFPIGGNVALGMLGGASPYGVSSITATLNATELGDSATASGTVVSSVGATLVVTEAGDTVTSVASIVVGGTGSTTDLADTGSAVLPIPVYARPYPLNLIKNSTLSNSGAGWQFPINGGGATASVQGFGVDPTLGYEYVDVRLTGTDFSGASLVISPMYGEEIVVGFGQTINFSGYFAVISGTIKAGATPVIRITQVDHFGNYRGHNATVLTPGATLVRDSVTQTIDDRLADRLECVWILQGLIPTPGPFDIVVRVAAPQLVIGSAPTTYYPTAGGSSGFLENSETVTSSASITSPGLTATLSVTESADTSTIAANVGIEANASISESGDTFTGAVSAIIAARPYPLNLISNSTFAGGTGISVESYAGVTGTIDSFGVDPTTGLEYADVRFTASAYAGGYSATINIMNREQSVVGKGTTINFSAYYALISGSPGTPQIRIDELNNVNAWLANSATNISHTGTLTRFNLTRTISDPAFSKLSCMLGLGSLPNGAFDIVVRIAAPQLVIGSAPTTYYPTSGGTSGFLENSETVVSSANVINPPVTATAAITEASDTGSVVMPVSIFARPYPLNLIPNSTFANSGAGITFSPSYAGVTSSIAGFGVDSATGYEYMDVRFTASNYVSGYSAAINPLPSSFSVVPGGVPVTFSGYLAIVSGTPAASVPVIRITESDNQDNYLNNNAVALPALTSSLAFGTVTHTLNNPRYSKLQCTWILSNLLPTGAFDIVFRIAAPQLVFGSSPGTYYPTAGGTSGFLESSETVASSAIIGNPPVIATSSITEAADISTSSGTVSISGTLAKTDDADTVASVGTLTVAGTLAKAESADTGTSAAQATIAGTLGASEVGDTLSSTVAVFINVVAPILETPDTLLGTVSIGNAPAIATANIAEGSDTAVGSAIIPITATLNKVEVSDTITSSATVADPPILGSLSVTEANDAGTSVGTIIIGGTLAQTEASDTAASIGTVVARGTAGITEAGDSALSIALVAITASSNITEATDSVTTSATVAWPPRSATLNVTEASDGLNAISPVIVRGTSITAEIGDSISSTAGIVISLAGIPPDIGDIVDSLAIAGKLLDLEDFIRQLNITVETKFSVHRDEYTYSVCSSTPNITFITSEDVGEFVEDIDTTAYVVSELMVV